MPRFRSSLPSRCQAVVLALAFLGVSAFADNMDVTINAGGKPALKISVPKDTKVSTKGEKTSLVAGHLQVHLWVVSAKDVAEVVPKAGETIKTEFVKYIVTSTETIKVLGHDAKFLKGRGEEADDNDPGTAEVAIFTDGRRVYVACVHGEDETAMKERPEFMKALESLKGL